VPPLGSLLPVAKRIGRGLTSGVGRLVGGGAGGAYGAGTAEEDENPLLRGLGYGALGGVVAPSALRAAGRGLNDFTYFSMLSSPDTIARGNFGAIGGALGGALEMATRGEFRNAARVVRSLAGEGKNTYLKAMRATPEEFGRMYEEIMPRPLHGAKTYEIHTQGVGIGRLFGAPDMVAVQALKRGGMSADDAARFTLTGEPQSQTGAFVLEQQRRMRGLGGVPGFVATQSAPFARVGLLGLEKGMQRLPVVGFGTDWAMKSGATRQLAKAQGKLAEAQASRQQAKDAAKAYKAFADKLKSQSTTITQAQTTKLMELRRALEGARQSRRTTTQATNLVEEAQKKLQSVSPTLGTQLSRQGVGAGAIAAGYNAPEGMDPRSALVLGPLAGAAFLPYQAGRELRRQRERGRVDPFDLGGELWKESSPFGFQPFGLFANPETEIPRRIIPSAVADVASFMDPVYGRERGRQALERKTGLGEYSGPTHPLLATALSRLPRTPLSPGRESLPETFAPVDVFGRPRYESPTVQGPFGVLGGGPIREGISRVVAPSLQTVTPPAMNRLDPQIGALADLGIRMNAPTANVTLPGTGLPLQQTAQSAAAVQRYRGYARQLAANIVLQLPVVQQLQDGPQKSYLVNQLMDQIQGTIAQAMSAGTLPVAVSQGAQLPAILRGRS